MNIITISWESGKWLSDYLHLSYYSKEILDAVASQCSSVLS